MPIDYAALYAQAMADFWRLEGADPTRARAPNLVFTRETMPLLSQYLRALQDHQQPPPMHGLTPDQWLLATRGRPRFLVIQFRSMNGEQNERMEALPADV